MSRVGLLLLALAAVFASAMLIIHPSTGQAEVPAATDILFVFDTTGSMADAITEAKAQATDVMTSLSGQLPNLRFGLAQVRDYGSTPVWRVEQGLTSNQSAVQTAINGLVAAEGGDLPEAYGTSLFQSRNDAAVGWATGAKHLVVLIADDVPHDNDLNQGVPASIISQPSPWNTGIDPGPSGTGIDWQQELTDFAAAQKTLAFVLYHGVPAYLPYWDWWAGLTGGQATESTSSTPLGDVLIEIITGTFTDTTPEQSTGTCNGAGTHANAGTLCQDDPVNSLTGAFTTGTTDLRLAGIGVPFSWRRSYTSADPTVGRLGPGWTDSYAASLLVQGNGDVIVHGDEGQQVYYTKQGDGSFVGAAGALSTLSSVTGGYKLVRRDQVTYLFNTQGRLTSMKDRNNQGVTLAYNGSGQLQTITDSVGRVITVTFVAGLLSRVTLPDARFVEYSYLSGRLSSVLDARGGLTQYTYDAGGRLATIVDQRGETIVRNVYDSASGRVLEQYDAFNNRSTFAWDAATRTATLTDARLNQWKDVYSGNLLIERIDPLGNRTAYEYDAGINVKKVTDARGNATSMTYDSRGNLLTRTAPAPLSYQEVWTYNTFNDPLTYRDGRGNVTDFGYDAAGNLTSVTGPDPDGAGPLARPQTGYGRDPAGTGLLTSITDPRGKQTTFSYTTGNLTEIRTHLGNRTTMGYDGSGRVTSLVDPRGHALGTPAQYTWTYFYNKFDQLQKQTDPLGNVTDLAYGATGKLLGRTDANLHLTSYRYDDANRLDKVTAPDPDGAGPLAAPVTLYTYDAVGNLKTRTDANLRQTVYDYDPPNRLNRVTAPLNRVWTYGYDANGNVTQMVDANGNATPATGDGQTTYAYDALNRLTSIDYSDATPDATFVYDANDNRTQMTDGAGTETYAYDALDRLTSLTRGTDTFSYGYDLANLTQRTYPGAVSTSYTYDDDNRLATAVQASLSTSYGYEAAGNLTATTLPSTNGHAETRLYDRAGRLTEVKNVKLPSTVRSRFVITLDPVGNPLQIVRTGTLAQTQTYTYDGMDRLKSVCFQAGTCPGASDPFIRWTYDGVGNRLTEARPTGTTSYTYNVADELTQAGSTAYTYDQNGNELSAGSRTFAYDLANRLKQTTQGATTTTYLYDGEGKRLQASTGAAASAKTNFLWDVSHALPQVALERNGSGVLQRQYIYGSRRIRQTEGAAGSYYLYDGLGSVVNTTAPAGALQKTYSYEPFGQIRTETGTSPTNFLHFTGEYLDPTGLYHLRARQYDPGSGRFLSRDPVMFALADPSVSQYAYVMNRPTIFLDPSGRSIGECLRHPLRCIENSSLLEELRERRNRAITSAFGIEPSPPPSTGVPELGESFSKFHPSWPDDILDSGREADFDTIWNGVRAGALVVACYEGYKLGRIAGPLWGVAGCFAGAIALDLGAENARHRIEESLE